MRFPAASGFYPFEKEVLESTVKELMKSNKSFEAIGAIVPHAGYMYSGSVAGKVFASIKTRAKTFFIFAPNHTGLGTSEVAASVDTWKTPLGEIKVNEELVKQLNLEVDEHAHLYEHAIEVQLPFLQVKFKEFTIVPLVFKHVELKVLEKLAASFPSDAFYIASSDFIHYGPIYGYMPAGINGLEWVKKTDKHLIKLIENLDYKTFYKTVVENGYTVCGFIPVTLLLILMKRFNAKAKLIDYKTSYEVMPSDSFVSYVGMVFEQQRE